MKLTEEELDAIYCAVWHYTYDTTHEGETMSVEIELKLDTLEKPIKGFISNDAAYALRDLLHSALNEWSFFEKGKSFEGYSGYEEEQKEIDNGGKDKDSD